MLTCLKELLQNIYHGWVTLTHGYVKLCKCQSLPHTDQLCVLMSLTAWSIQVEHIIDVCDVGFYPLAIREQFLKRHYDMYPVFGLPHCKPPKYIRDLASPISSNKYI